MEFYSECLKFKKSLYRVKLFATLHGILQARILEQVAFPFSRGSSQPGDQTQVSHIAGRFFSSWATSVAAKNHVMYFVLV